MGYRVAPQPTQGVQEPWIAPGRHKSLVWIHACLLTSYTLAFIVLTSLALPASRCRDPFGAAIAGATLRPTVVPYHTLRSGASPYAGAAPNSSIDAAWAHLLAGINMRFTPAELVADSGSVALPDGGALGWLGMHHELHCLKMLREWAYRDHYHAGKPPGELEHLRAHADHCVEMLRLSALCHADSSLTTFRWDPRNAKPTFDSREEVHHCWDADALLRSLNSRVVPDEEMARMQNPLLA